MAKGDLLIAWLNDAYAMQRTQDKMQEQFVKDFDTFPNIQEKIREHLNDSRRQARDIRSCIKRLGGKVSMAKWALADVAGMVQGMSTGPYQDVVVKNLLIMHAAEHFEHLSYSALAAGARACGENDIANVCEHIAGEERAFADWIAPQIPNVVTAVMEAQGER